MSRFLDWAGRGIGSTQKVNTLLLVRGAYLALTIAATTCAEHAPGQQNNADQQALDTAPFHFNLDEANAGYSLKQSDRKRQIEMINAPSSGKLVFNFACNNKKILSLEGHAQSVFRIAGNTLFFAHFSPTRTGCVVAAYDLNNCKEVWRTKLNGLGKITHEQYRNRVTIDVSDNDRNGDGVVSITGNETYGDYVEVLDQKTGRQLAHKVYRRTP